MGRLVPVALAILAVPAAPVKPDLEGLADLVALAPAGLALMVLACSVGPR